MPQLCPPRRAAFIANRAHHRGPGTPADARCHAPRGEARRVLKMNFSARWAEMVTSLPNERGARFEFATCQTESGAITSGARGGGTARQVGPRWSRSHLQWDDAGRRTRLPELRGRLWGPEAARAIPEFPGERV